MKRMHQSIPSVARARPLRPGREEMSKKLKIMAENNDANSGPGTPARSGPATGSGAVKVGVYDQPARPAKSPLMKWLPILIALAVLGFLAYRFLGAGPAVNTNDTTTNSAPAAVNDSANTNRMSGNNNGGSTTTGTGSATTANPPGPAGAATRP
jgi:hypothetical protein